MAEVVKIKIMPVRTHERLMTVVVKLKIILLTTTTINDDKNSLKLRLVSWVRQKYHVEWDMEEPWAYKR